LTLWDAKKKNPGKKNETEKCQPKKGEANFYFKFKLTFWLEFWGGEVKEKVFGEKKKGIEGEYLICKVLESEIP